MNSAALKHISESRLENDLGYRFQYLAEFIGFGQSDIDAIHATAPYLAPLVSGLVDAIYVKLFSYDATKRHFVPRHAGYEGAVPQDLHSLTLDHSQIVFRKAHLIQYFKRLISGDYDLKMLGYLDFVGKIHTAKAGNKDIQVPLVQMNALLGFVSDVLVTALLDMPISLAQKTAAIRAFNKLLWLQHDLISRHYLAG